MLRSQQANPSFALSAYHAKNDTHEHFPVPSLDTRWHQIRISPIQEELKLFTGLDIKFFFQTPPIRTKIIPGIYIDMPALPKSIEAIAAILAFQWGMLASHHLPNIYSKLLKNPIDLVSEKQQADKFSAIFLAHFKYDIQKLVDYLNNSPNLPPCYNSSEAASLRAQKIAKTYKKVCDINYQYEKKLMPKQVIPLSYNHYALSTDIF